MLNSCNEEQEDNGEYSPEFTLLLKKVNAYNEVAKQPVKAIHFLDDSFKKLKHPFSADRFRYYGLHYLYEKETTHDIKKSSVYADSMLTEAKKSVTKKQYDISFAEANFAAGDAAFTLGQYSDAYKYFYQGYFIGKNLLNNAILAEYTYRMGMILFKQGHFVKAASYFKISYEQSMAYKNDFKAFYQQQELLADIGESYKNAMMLDSATLYFTKTLYYINANAERFKNAQPMLEVARGVIYGDQGEIAYITRNYADAEFLFERSIAINLQKGADTHDAQLNEIKLARLYLDQKNPEKLISLLKRLRIQLDSLSNPDVELNWNYLMSQYHTQKKDYPQALHYLRTYSALRDSSIKKLSTFRNTDVNQQQANFDKQAQIDSLKNHNKLQFVYINLALLFFIMAVIIIFLVVGNLRRSKGDVLAVKALNDQINEQNTNLEHTLGELKENSMEKDRILRAVAHDLRNPIGGIASLTSMMTEEDGYNDEQKTMLNLIKETSFNSIELINEILEATNTASSKFRKEKININALISNSVELMRFKASEKNQAIKQELLPYTLEISMSREKIWRVISNLISNAIKFSKDGATITVKATDFNHEVQISVEDNGIGIPHQIQNEVFNMFTSAKRVGTAGEKSFGLGLSICRQIIEKHNGRIWFRSNTDNGTTFYIALPK